MFEEKFGGCPYLLLDVDVGRACTANADADMIIGKILPCKLAHIPAESC